MDPPLSFTSRAVTVRNRWFVNVVQKSELRLITRPTTSRGGTGKAGHWAKRDTEVIMTSQLKLARADKKLSAT